MRKYFSGRYYKCQSDTQTLALISAVHNGKSSVQIICDEGAFFFDGDPNKSSFSDKGIRLCLDGAAGELRFGSQTPLKYDIMGPFKYVPFMQCRHGVYSMRHRVDGELTVNGASYKFDNAEGYTEGDSGYSFPKEYAWTQSFFDGGSLMLSVADIPFAGLRFTGIIGAVLLHGREYRLATYLGARLIKAADGEIELRQSRYSFSAKLIERRAHPLSAPVGGDMVRTIHESVCCRAAYCFKKDSKTLLEFETDRASFEYEFGGKG